MTDQDRSDLEEAIRLLRVVRSIKPGLTFIGIMSGDDWAAKVDALLARHPEKPKLLPCPFCGGKAHLDKSYGKIRIECGGCGAKVTRDTIDAERRAIDAWNSRATPASGPLSGGKGE